LIEAELREQPGVRIRNVHRMACANTAKNCKRSCASSPVFGFATFTGWLAPIPLTIASGAVIEAELREQPGVAIHNVHRMACANSA